MHGVAFGADLTAARVFGDTYYEWRLDPDKYYRPRAVYRTDPDDAATLDMYAQIQAQGVRAINHSWGISTRNMTAAALDQQYANIGADYGVYGSIYASNGDTPAPPSSRCGRLATAAAPSPESRPPCRAGSPNWNRTGSRSPTSAGPTPLRAKPTM